MSNPFDACEFAPVTDQIRRDLFAVKVYGDGNHWCLEHIFTTLAAAQGYRFMVESNHSRMFPLMRPVIFHPRQSLVDSYLACGNRI